MIEIWEDIDNYIKLYQVSNMGRIRSLDHTRKAGTGSYVQKGQIIKPYITRGYFHVKLTKEGKVRDFQVHRLVAQTFICNQQNKPQVNHIDGNKLNNCVNNLEWCTQSENMVHAYKIGLEKPIYGRENPRAKRVIQYNLQGGFISEYMSTMEAERKTKIKHANISRCCKGRYKTAGGYKWEYAM